jgi:hypothetical protein
VTATVPQPTFMRLRDEFWIFSASDRRLSAIVGSASMILFAANRSYVLKRFVVEVGVAID